MIEPEKLTTTTTESPFTGEVETLGNSTRLALQSAHSLRSLTAASLVVAGLEMAAAKAALGNTRGRPTADGKKLPTWADWLAIYTVGMDGKAMSETWSAQLMHVAKGMKRETQNRDLLALLDVAPSQLTLDDRKMLETEADKFAGSRGISTLIAEFGCRTGRKTGNGGNNHTGGVETQPACYTAEMWAHYQTLEDGSEQKIACSKHGLLIRDLLPIGSEHADVSSPHLPHLPALFVVEIHAALLQATKRLAAMLPKSSKKKKPAKKRKPAKQKQPTSTAR